MTHWLSLPSCMKRARHPPHPAVKTALKRNANIGPGGELPTNAQSSIAPNSPNLDTTQRPSPGEGKGEKVARPSAPWKYRSAIKGSQRLIWVKRRMSLKSQRSRMQKTLAQLSDMEFLEKAIL